MKHIGLITYDHPHLKTEQVLLNLLGRFEQLTLFVLPYKFRAARQVQLNHRPAQDAAIAPRILAKKHNLELVTCNAETDIDNRCDLYLVLGAGVLSPECVAHKRILNAHPGILPSCRGLDAFKWAILHRKPLGNTLHYIDAEVDAGEIVSVLPTPVYEGDTLETLARRHYEREIRMMSDFEQHIASPCQIEDALPQGDATRRMPADTERDMITGFAGYLELFANR